MISEQNLANDGQFFLCFIIDYEDGIKKSNFIFLHLNKGQAIKTIETNSSHCNVLCNIQLLIGKLITQCIIILDIRPL